MVPLVDIHCHLLAGLDDGPRRMDDALVMCAAAYAEGVRLMAATAHQNPRWPDVTPARIRTATAALRDALAKAGCPMSVFPCAEVMAQPETVEDWQAHRLLSVADRGRYVLLEMPHGVFVDLMPMVRRLRQAGVRPILAHPEREAQFLHEGGVIEALIEAGALVQVSSASITDPRTAADGRALQSWFQRGIVHFLGSDGHSPTRRPPKLAGAFDRVSRWVGPAQADRIGSANGLAVAHGLPLQVAPPMPKAAASWWFLQLW
jgi:protein-tyrosine phosphatase